MTHCPSFSLTGKTALVTGASSGIGQAIALAMAEAGADVAVTQHSASAADTVAQIEAMGRRAATVQADMSTLDAAGAEALVAEVEAALAPIDVLVNNAGTIRREDAAQHSQTDWTHVMGANLNSVWFLSQAAGRGMIDRGWGRIIQTASVLSFQGGIRVPGYTTAKHGVAGLTKALANEWAGSGVAVNAIAPGYIATDNTAPLRADPERSKAILERIPAGRWGDPQDIAGAAVFLASDAGAYVHGTVLTVDGGWMGR